MESISKPKVFISYSWGTDEYQDKVLQFCMRLQSECGISVIVDKWSMDAGNDTYDFMERCVKDPTVNFVIMLLDKKYADKANARHGGVGTETQIISARVYADTSQNKFIPVIFERGEKREIYKPEYLQSRLHFDLTKENANDEFMRLVRHLYGEKTYPMPPVGSKPDWVSQPQTISPIISGPLSTISNSVDEKVIKKEAKQALKSILNNYFDISITDKEVQQFQVDLQKYLDFLGTLRPYRDSIIMILNRIAHQDFFTDVVSDFFEEYQRMQDEHRHAYAFLSQARNAFIHEAFLYVIALLWGADEYSKIHDLVMRTYFIGGGYRATGMINEIVYAGKESDLIENAKRKVDNKNYISGLAQLWTEHVIAGFSLNQITFADLLIYNLSVFEWQEGSWYWFPIMYIYGLRNPIFERMAVMMKSSRQIKRMQELFNESSPARLKEKFQAMTKVRETNSYRFSNAFDRAPLLIDYIKAEEIGSLP